MAVFNKKLKIGLLALALLSPLGVMLPKIFHAGNSWGEWSTEIVAKDKGFVPKGMEKNSKLYKAPIQNYNLGKENISLRERSGYYIVSAMIGIGTIAIITYFATKFFNKK